MIFLLSCIGHSMLYMNQYFHQVLEFAFMEWSEKVNFINLSKIKFGGTQMTVLQQALI